MQARAARFIASTSAIMLILAASVSQAAPGETGPPGDVPPGQVISGHLSIVHGDDFDEKANHAHGALPDHVLPQMQYWLETDSGEELLLEFPGHPPEATPEGYYSVGGQRHGRTFHVQEMREGEAPGGSKGGGGGGGGKKSTVPSFVGPRDMIAIPFIFKNDPTPLTFTPEQIRERAFTGARSVKTFYSEGSSTTNPANPLLLRGKNDGATSAPLDKDGLPGDVTSVYSIDGSTTTCDYRTWASNAKAAATADGWDLTGYEHVVYIHPRVVKADGTAVCSYGGLAEIGGDESWLNGNISLGVWAHELGHNLTLYHSRTLICSDGEVFISVARSGCTYEEYGDPFDTMGQAPAARHYHGRNKAHMSWFPTANIVTGADGGEYTLYPLETVAVGPQLLQIARTRNEYVYVDFRQPFGTFDNYAATDDAVTGAMVRIGPSTATNGNSWLIDTSMFPLFVDANEDPPDTEPEFLDAALQVGEGWVDTVSGIYIETLEVVGGTVRVLVRTRQANAAPEVAVGAPSSVILPGVPHQAPNATATDTHKNLGMYRWSWRSCPSTCPALTGLTEGALSGGSDTISGPVYIPTERGDYTLTLTVWDTAGSRTVTEVTETVGI